MAGGPRGSCKREEEGEHSGGHHEPTQPDGLGSRRTLCRLLTPRSAFVPLLPTSPSSASSLFCIVSLVSLFSSNRSLLRRRMTRLLPLPLTTPRLPRTRTHSAHKLGFSQPEHTDRHEGILIRALTQQRYPAYPPISETSPPHWRAPAGYVHLKRGGRGKGIEGGTAR
jgi:hypothetical protein